MPQPFNNAVMTDDGIALLTKAQAGEVRIEFTRMAAGSGEYTADEKSLAYLQECTALKSLKNSYPLSGVTVFKEHSVKITAFIMNYDAVRKEVLVEEGYYINEIGLFAKPLGGADDTEILYSIAVTAGDRGDFMPPYNGYNVAQITQDYYVTVNNSAAITIDATGAPALAEDIQTVKDQLGEHTVKSDVPENAIFANMVGATETAAGSAGYVPAPVAGAQEKYLSGDGTWKPVLESLEAVKANTQSGYIAGALALKKALGTVLEQTLTAGATTVTFTSDAITDDSMIDIYTDPYCSGLTAVEQDGNTLELTFDAQNVNMRVCVKVG